jgi:nucleoside 2-deoxyribosyltransferase
MQTIYLCGPIAGCTDDEAITWRERVKTYGSTGGRFWTRDPMDRDYRGIEATAVREIVELDKRDVRAVDVVLVNYSKPSVGTAMEILYAWEQGVPVVLWAKGDVPLSPWLVYHSTVIVHTFVDAMEAVERIGK